jgi:hypothetical protein
VQQLQAELAAAQRKLAEQQRKDRLAHHNAQTHAVQKVPRREVQVALQQLVKSIDSLCYTQKVLSEDLRLKREATIIKADMAELKKTIDEHLDRMCEVITLLHPNQPEDFVEPVNKKRRFRAELEAEDAAAFPDEEETVVYNPSSSVFGSQQPQCKKRTRQCHHRCCFIDLFDALLILALLTLARCCSVARCFAVPLFTSECRCKVRGEATCSSKACGCLAAGKDCGSLCECGRAGIACKNSSAYREERSE